MPVRGYGRKTGDMRENRANGPGKTAAPPGKTAARPEKRQNGCRPLRRAGGCATGRPEGLKARGQSRKPPRKPRERSPRLGEKGPAQTDRGRGPDTGRSPAMPRAGAGAGVKTKTGGGPRRREKTEMQEQGRKQGERASPCAWRYSSPGTET